MLPSANFTVLQVIGRRLRPYVQNLYNLHHPTGLRNFSASSKCSSADRFESDRKQNNNVQISQTSEVKSERVSPKVAALRLELKQWKPIYRFKPILWARAIQRIKIYQTIFTCAAILPYSIAIQIYGIGDYMFTYIAFGGSVLACAMLYVMGTFCSRIVGNVYIHKDDPERINLARLTFWGSREDKHLHAKAFVPLSDLNINPQDAYVNLQIEDLELKQELGPLYLSLRFGEILDVEGFERVFGSLEALGLTRRGQ